MPEVLKFLMTDKPDSAAYLSARNYGLSIGEAENAACVYNRVKSLGVEGFLTELE